MATQTFKIDQQATFAGLAFVQCTAKTKFGTDEQDSTKDGTPKWTIEVLAAVRDGRGGTRNEVLKIGIAARSNPGEAVPPLSPVELGGFELGVMDRNGGGCSVFYRCDELLNGAVPTAQAS